MSFRAAVESHDLDALEAALDPEVEFKSPAVYEAYRGREATMGLLRVVLPVFEDFRYVGAVRDGDDEVLRFAARVGETELEGVDLIRCGPDGLVRELTVMIRPRSGLEAVLGAVQARMAARG